MRYNKSEILEEYAKIIGLVSNAEEEESKDDISSIGLLYGLKPEGIDYDYNIVEKAHPDTAVIIPANDLMNSIVENVNQRNNIMNQIALKEPNGQYIQGRYVAAYNDLIKSVVKAGFKLDSDNDIKLMKLADKVAGQLEKEEVGGIIGALLPASALGWVSLGIAALIGSIYMINNTEDSRQNVVANSDRALSELQDLEGKMPVDNIMNDIAELKAAATSFNAVAISALDTRSVMNAAKEHQDDIKKSQEYSKVLERVSAAIPEYIEQLHSFQPSGSSYDWIEKIKNVIHEIIPDDVQDAVNALKGLAKAMEVDKTAISYVEAKSRDLAPQIEEQLKQNNLVKAQQTSVEQAPVPSAQAPVPAAQVQNTIAPIVQNESPEDVNKDYNDLFNILSQ